MDSCLDDILPMDMTIVLSDIEILEAQLLQKENSNYPTDMSNSILQLFTTKVMSSSLNNKLPMVIKIEDSDEEKRSKSKFSTDEGTNYGTDISISPNSYEKEDKSNGDSSVKILYEVGNVTDSDSDTSGVKNKKVSDVNNICSDILLNILYKNIQDS